MKYNLVTVLLVLLVGIFAFAFRGAEGINGFLSFFFAGSLVWVLMNYRVNQPKIEGLEKKLAEQKKRAVRAVIILVIMTLIVTVYAYFADQNFFHIILNPTAVGIYVVALALWFFSKRSIQ